MTFSMSYFYNDLFILHLLPDEVVHGKKTMVDKVAVSRAVCYHKGTVYFPVHSPWQETQLHGQQLEYLEWRDEKSGWNLLHISIHDSLHEYVKALQALS